MPYAPLFSRTLDLGSLSRLSHASVGMVASLHPLLGAPAAVLEDGRLGRFLGIAFPAGDRLLALS
jgi:hypothetical protein